MLKEHQPGARLSSINSLKAVCSLIFIALSDSWLLHIYLQVDASVDS